MTTAPQSWWRWGAILVVVGSLACATVGSSEHLVGYNGHSLGVVLSTKLAASSLGKDWLVLSVSIAGKLRQSVEVPRSGIFVVAPTGERVALPSYQEFSAAYSRLGGLIRRAEMAREPMGYFGADRQRCRLGFFTTPSAAIADVGAATVSDTLIVTDRTYCSGELFFPITAGVRPGVWVLGIDLEQERVRIPFTLPAQ